MLRGSLAAIDVQTTSYSDMPKSMVIFQHLPWRSTSAGITKVVTHLSTLVGYLIVLCRHQNEVCIIIDPGAAETTLTVTSDAGKPAESISPRVAGPVSSLTLGQYPQTLAPAAYTLDTIHLSRSYRSRTPCYQ